MASSPSLPTFVIAGAMRSGTTALSAWLRDHPSVFMAPAKEVHYFDRNYDRGMEWYAGNFDGAGTAKAVGEATPNYIYHGQALERLKSDLPNTKVLILLRDPVLRAYSHYLHRRARDEEDLSFEDAIAAEQDRLGSGDELVRAHYSYVDRGRYLNQLEHLLEVFPRDAVLIHLFEDLRDRPRSVFSSVAEFIGVDPELVPSRVGRQANAYQEFRSLRLRRLSQHLPSGARRIIGRLNRVDAGDYPELPLRAKSMLAEIFAEERPQLARLLGRNLEEWRS